MNKSAAIEFSANVILIIIISSVILGLGLMLFFNLKGQAEKYTDSIEQQTAEQLKALMLNDNSRVAIYPNDLTIQPGKSQMTTVGVTNSLDNTQTFQTSAVQDWVVYYYQTPESTGELVQHTTNPTTYKQANFANTFVISTSGTSLMSFGRIVPGEQNFKNILIKVPKNWKKGQYIVNIAVKNYTTNFCNNPSMCPVYGLAKLYITVP